MITGCKHHSIIVNDIEICNLCTRIVKHDSYDQNPNVKPVVIKEGHVPGIEFASTSGQVAVYYEGKPWAQLSVATPEMEHITQRIIQSVAKAYIREGSLTAARSMHDQVQAFIQTGHSDDDIINEFPRDKRDTVRRYIRDIRKEKKNGSKPGGK